MLRAMGDTTTPDVPQRPNSMLRFLRDVLVIVVAALVVAFLVKTFVVRSFSIPSGSMRDTLQVEDHVIVNELATVHRGDVVVFHDPGGWLGRRTQQQSLVADALGVVGLGPGRDDHLIKRVIGVPGDHVRCCNALGQMEVDGVPLSEPYVRAPADRPASGEPFDVTVPPGRLWVMGDNRYESADSRAHQGLPSKGFVPEREVVGRAVLISWPLGRWAWIDDHYDVFAGIERGRDDDDGGARRTP
jgi:signal peptidase I